MRQEYSTNLWVMPFVGSILGRQVWAYTGGHRLYPNFWIVLIAPSSFFRKTTSLYTARRILQKANPDRILPEEFSQEKLFETLQEKPIGTFFYSEFMSLMGLLKRDYMAGCKAFLTMLYDSLPYPYIRTTKNATYTIQNPCISLLTATTTDWFLAETKATDMRGGFFFLPRFLLVPARKKKEKHLFDEVIPDISQENFLVAELNELARIQGQIHIAHPRPYHAWCNKISTNLSL